MKIISWNLENFGPTKISDTFEPAFSSFGLGGDPVDFITRFVTAHSAWHHVQTPVPVDVFVIIELKSGGRIQRAAASGSCWVVLSTLCSTLNNIMIAQGVNDEYHYDFVPPMVTGQHETIGVIYNSKKLKVEGFGIPTNLRTNRNLPERGPFCVDFSLTEDNDEKMFVAGVHAIPCRNGGDRKYHWPIHYNRQLAETFIPQKINPFVVGDFNCEPNSQVLLHNAPIYAFTELFNQGFITNLPDGSFSSIRNGLKAGVPPPLNYLSEAYDNGIFRFPTNVNQSVVDIVGTALDLNNPGQPAFASHPDLVFRSFRSVTNHFPVIMDF